jgi:uncharacterized protein YcnI
MRKVFVLLAAGAFGIALTAPALAHVTVQPREALAESFSKFVVRVPTEREDASTITVEVKFPPMAFVGFADVPGWTREVKMKKLDEPLEAFGESLTEVVGTVTWSGGEVEPHEFIEFPFSAAMPEGEQTLEFPAIQTYDSGEVVRWTGPEDSDAPAGTITTVELGRFQEEGLAELGTLHEVVHELEEIDATVDELEVAAGDQAPTGSGENDDEDDDDSDTMPMVLGGAGAGLGLIALIVALRKRSA